MVLARAGARTVPPVGPGSGLLGPGRRLRRILRGRPRRIPRHRPRSTALWTVDRCQIGSKFRRRGRTARIMLLQELEQRGARAAPGKTGRARMACRATIIEQLDGRFALIEILRVRRGAAERNKRAEREQSALPLLL